jgi:hypothetical protein
VRLQLKLQGRDGVLSNRAKRRSGAILLVLASTIGDVRAARADRPDAALSPEAKSGPAPALPEGSQRAPSRPPSNIDATVSSEIASYADTDHVFVQTPSIAGRVEDPIAGYTIDAQYLVDVVSAASVDIVSTASRRWEEVRQEGTLNAAYKPGTLGVSATGNVSSEPDYLSWTAGGAVTQDVLDKSVTWLAGMYHTHDVAGRTGTPFSIFSRSINRDAFKLGVTVVLDRRTVASFVGDFVTENGDQSKVYRYIPLFAPGTNVPIGASVDEVTSLRVSARPLEQLPLSRERYAVSGRLAHHLHGSTLRLDERLYTDSWGLKATTTDARLLFDLTPRIETGPHLRFHAQSPVSFWQRAYIFEPGFNFPALRTGDRELGPLVGATEGWTIRMAVGNDRHPRAWILGFDLNVAETKYLDDLYVTQRLSAVGGMTLAAEL